MESNSFQYFVDNKHFVNDISTNEYLKLLNKIELSVKTEREKARSANITNTEKFLQEYNCKYIEANLWIQKTDIEKIPIEKDLIHDPQITNKSKTNAKDQCNLLEFISDSNKTEEEAVDVAK